MKFEDFYQLFLVVCCQQGRAEQNALLLTKIYKLLGFVKISEPDQAHVSD
jgi:hypothetical protein